MGTKTPVIIRKETAVAPADHGAAESRNAPTLIQSFVTANRESRRAPPTASVRALARICLACPVCRRARRRQRGLAFLMVRRVEGRVCPFCRAYERVFGRTAHERPDQAPAASPAK